VVAKGGESPKGRSLEKSKHIGICQEGSNGWGPVRENTTPKKKTEKHQPRGHAKRGMGRAKVKKVVRQEGRRKRQYS